MALGGEIPVGAGSNPSVVSDADGDFVIVWERSDGVYARRYAVTGTPQGPELFVGNFVGNGDFFETSVAMNDRGDFVIVWENALPGDSGFGVYCSSYSSLGQRRSYFLVDSYYSPHIGDPSVSMDDVGNFAVAWVDDSNASYGSGVYIERYDAFGVPLGERLKEDWLSFSPLLAMRSNGDFLIAAQATKIIDPFGSQIVQGGVAAKAYTASGVPTGEAFDVSEFTSGGAVPLDIAMDGNGNFVVTWVYFVANGGGGFSEELSARRFKFDGNPFGGEFHLPGYSIAMDAGGDVTVTWSNSGDVYGQLYTPSGTPLGSEFRVGAGQNPSAAFQNNNGFVAVWVGSGGIRARRFGPGPPPLVVNVATHGWNSSGAKWNPYATVLNSMPIAGSELDGRVTTYVADWDSDTGFTEGFLQLAVAKILATFPGFAVAANLLKSTAQLTAKISGGIAVAEAHSIVGNLQTGKFLLPPIQSNQSQKIQLIGHSRGAAVNALVSRLLEDIGYHNIVLFAALDGFSTDWPDDAGLIGDISIVDNATVGTGGKKLNFEVQLGIAGLIIDSIIDWLPIQLGRSSISVGDIPLVDAAIWSVLGDLRAPDRSAYHFVDTLISGQGTLDPSTHTNISELYFDYAPYYRFQSYVGEHANDGSGSTGASLGESILDFTSGRGAGANLTSTATFGFLDGKFDELGEIYIDALAANPGPVGDLLIDYFLQRIDDPAAVLANVWEIVGNAHLIELAGNFAAQLNTSLEGTSVSQFVILPPQASAVEFDLHVLSTGPEDTLSVLLDGTALGSFHLSEMVDSRRSVLLPGTAGVSGTIMFRLNSPPGSTASITLDNLNVAAQNAAPLLTAEHPELPPIPWLISDAYNQGKSLSELESNIFDSDPDSRSGIAIIGAKNVYGKTQFSQDGGASWSDIGEVTEANALLLGLEDGNRVRFVPDADFSGVVNDVVTFRAWDRTTGIAGLSGDYFDASQVGGLAPFSEDVDSYRIKIVPTGDYNRDGTVNGLDYVIWKSNYGSTTELVADGNGDAVVNTADYSIWRDNLGAKLTFEESLLLSGDYNLNGGVDAADYSVWRNNLVMAPHPGPLLEGESVIGDGNGDGVVDALDYAVWKRNFGATLEHLGAGGRGQGVQNSLSAESVKEQNLVAAVLDGNRQDPFARNRELRREESDSIVVDALLQERMLQAWLATLGRERRQYGDVSDAAPPIDRESLDCALAEMTEMRLAFCR